MQRDANECRDQQARAARLRWEAMLRARAVQKMRALERQRAEIYKRFRPVMKEYEIWRLKVQLLRVELREKLVARVVPGVAKD